ncbi:TPA: hypothetical protein IOH10_001343 [Salmonella enterica]|nr:hypothetical protein [Salmonella enterica]
MVFGRGCEQYWELADWVPVNVLIDEWCKSDKVCKEAKRAAIFSACERGYINYRRSDGKTWDDPVYDIWARGLLLIEKKSFFDWVSQFTDPTAPKEKITTRERNNLYAIIGGLLYLLVNNTRNNQAGIITQLISLSKEKEPFSKSNLEKVFGEANKSLVDKEINLSINDDNKEASTDDDKDEF